MSDEIRQKQLDIVLKLNKLTKKGKIRWSRSTRSTSDLGKRVEQFEANYKGRTFRLEEVSELSMSRSMLQYESEDSPRLIVSDSDEESSIAFPPIPAIDELMETVRRRHQGGDIEELEKIDRLLEEDL